VAGTRGLGRLGVRLALAFVGVALAAILIFALAALAFDEHDVANFAETQRAATTSSLVSKAASIFRESGGWAGADLSPVTALARSYGVGLVVWDEDGRRLATAPAPRAPVLSTTSEVTVDARIVGSLRTVFSTNAAFPGGERLRSALAGAVAVSAGIAAFGALVAGVLLSRRLTRPLRGLVERVEQVEAGERDVRFEEVRAPGELGELATALDEMTSALDRQEALRRAMVADVAHELRTPLATLQAHTEALVDGVTPLDAGAAGSLHEEAVRLSGLVKDLEVLASAEAAGLHLDREPLDLADVAARAVDAARSEASSAGVSLDGDLEPAPVKGDALRLGQVVSNLVSNSLKFTPPGGRVQVKVRVSDGSAVLEVVDNGAGIAPQDQGRVFDRFWRGEETRGVSGSGVGLAVVKSLVEVHGGTVGLSSEPGVETRFVVSLPSCGAV
jgi:two-component system sensor histidine kinase BaeS